MELESKHLAAYLPYGLKLQYVVRDVVERTGVMINITHDLEATHPTQIALDYYDSEHIWMFRPILKPFDDALKIEAFTDLFSEYSLENLKISFYALGSRSLCWKSRIDLEQYEWLLENHYDVFGLIDFGLAIADPTPPTTK